MTLRLKIAAFFSRTPAVLMAERAFGTDEEGRYWLCPECDARWPAQGPPWPISSHYGGESPPCPNPDCSTHYGVRDYMRRSIGMRVKPKTDSDGRDLGTSS